ncbi:MAG: condensation domain-containing protein, partial [Cyanobacteria bacterium P01_F01_bin.143]
MLTETTEGFRLSLQQEYLWSLDKDNITDNYCAQCAILIEGSLNLTILKAALEKVVDKYEILRTNFRYLPGITIPVQVIAHNLKALGNYKYYDFSDLTLQQQDKEIKDILGNQLPLNFQQESLFKTSLATLSQNRHILMISMSAMLADAKTLDNLVRELSYSYSVCLQGEKENVLEQPLQYVDFAEWQHEVLTAEETEIGREYWRKQDFSTLDLKLPIKRNLTEQAEFLPRLFTANLTPQLSQKIQAIASEKNTSIANFLLACWQVLLWRLTQQEEFTIGIGCAGREHSELEATLGLFAKYLPLSFHLSDELLFSQVLDRIGQSVKEVYRWQECFSWQEISKSDLQNPFFPVSFDFQEEATTYSQDNVSFSLYKQFICIDRFNLRLSCRSQQNSIVTDFYYDSARFELEAIEELQEQFYQLVESAANNPQAKISTLRIISDRAWQKLLVEFNQTKTEYPQDKCLPQLLESQVAKTPDNIAVVFEEQ